LDPGVWFSLFVLFFAGGLTPGPAVMLTLASALKYGFRLAMVAALGIAAANLVWISLAASGAGALAKAFPDVFMALKLLGLCFIGWLAFSMAFGKDAARRVEARDAPPRAVLFGRGVGLQLANPNALVFFGGMLPAFFDPVSPLGPQVAFVIITITLTELFGLAIYAAAAKALARKFSSERFARNFNRLAAGLMVSAALYGVIATWNGV
jgi:homoserine/homoserine lactone efflux protein